MEDAKIIKLFPFGVVTPPPSKSLSHRAAICAALAAKCNTGGESLIRGFGDSEDVDATLEGIKALGAGTMRENGSLRVFSTVSNFIQYDGPVDCGESGSTLRFLIPILALDKREVILTGRGGLLQRPLEVYKNIFAAAGAELIREKDRIIVRGPLRSGVYELPGDVSSQFVSGLLFALPLLEGDSEIRLSSPLQSRRYAELTIEVMSCFGVQVEKPNDMRFLVRGGQLYRPSEYKVEADYSQAAFFLAAAALGRDVSCRGLNPGSSQGDRAILKVLEEMGAKISWEDDLVTIRAEKLSAVRVDAGDIPDLIPPIAALCCFCEGTSEIVNAGRLRFKESDRLRAMSTELSRLGANIIEGEESLSVKGLNMLRGGKADAWGDHRIAMSMALAAIRCEEPVELTGWQSVNKSYPDFWKDFEKEGL